MRGFLCAAWFINLAANTSPLTLALSPAGERGHEKTVLLPSKGRRWPKAG